MKTITSLLICLSLVFVPSKQQSQCHTERLNECWMPTVLAGARNLIPENEKNLEKRCTLYKKSITCTDNFIENCLAHEHQTMANLFMDHSRPISEEWCEKGSQFQKDFLEIAPCLSEAVTNTHRVCMNNVENIVYQATGDDIEARVPAGCCFFNQFMDCFYDEVEKSCGKDSFPVVEKASNMMNLPFIRQFCSSFDPTSELCHDVLTKNATEPSEKYSYLARFTIAILKHRS